MSEAPANTLTEALWERSCIQIPDRQNLWDNSCCLKTLSVGTICYTEVANSRSFTKAWHIRFLETSYLKMLHRILMTYFLMYTWAARKIKESHRLEMTRRENPVTDKQIIESVLPWSYLPVPGGLGPGFLKDWQDTGKALGLEVWEIWLEFPHIHHQKCDMLSRWPRKNLSCRRR